MEGGAIILFMISIVLFVAAVVVVLFTTGDTITTNSGFPLPNSTKIGAQCPVGCTCFPNTGATTPTDKPTQFCGFLDNGVMFGCPARCCQPTCINQDVQGIAQRYTV